MKRFLILSIVLILVLAGCVANKPQTLSGVEKIAEKKSIAENNPNNEWCWFYLGDAYNENGQYREAIQAYNQAASKPRPLRHIDEWSLYTKISLAYKALGEFDAAVPAQKKAVELNPQRVDGYTALSSLYLFNKQYDEAIATAKRALEIEPENANALTTIGAALSSKKQYREAQASLQRALQANPMNIGLYFTLGDILFDQNAYDEEAIIYKKGIEASDADTRTRVANSPYIKQFRPTQKERERLQSTYTKDMEASSATPALYGRLAKAYYSMGRYAEALAAVNKGVDLLTTPDGIGITYSFKNGVAVVTEVMNVSPAPKAGFKVGDTIKWCCAASFGFVNLNEGEQVFLDQVRYYLREADEANIPFKVLRNGVEIEIVVTRGQTIDNKAAALIALRSLVHRRLNDPARGASDAALAASIDPASDWVRFAIGVSQFDRGQFEEASKTLSPLKDSVAARLIEATAYAKQGKMREALESYIAVEPTGISAKNVPQASDMRAMFTAFAPYANAHRDKAKAFESKGQYREALSELSEAMKAADGADAQLILDTCFAIARKSPVSADAPEEARKHAIRSEVLVKDGNFERASSELNKAIAVAPYVAQFYYNAALIHAEARQFQEAIRSMKTYLSAAPDSPHARAARDEIVKWEFMLEQKK